MLPKDTPDQRDKKAQAYADTVPDGTVDTDYEPTYLDGSLKNECWDSRNNNTLWRDDTCQSFTISVAP